MHRILFLLVLFLVIFLVVKSFKRKKRQAALSKPKKTNVVKCQQCGVHIPIAEATVHEGKNFCCLEHANLYNQHKNLR